MHNSSSHSLYLILFQHNHTHVSAYLCICKDLNFDSSFGSIAAFTKCPSGISLHHTNPKHYLHLTRTKIGSGSVLTRWIPFLTLMHTTRLVLCMASCVSHLSIKSDELSNCVLFYLKYNSYFVLQLCALVSLSKRLSRVKWRFDLQRAHGIKGNALQL